MFECFNPIGYNDLSCIYYVGIFMVLCIIDIRYYAHCPL